MIEVKRHQLAHAELAQLAVGFALHRMIDIEHTAMFAQRGGASKIYLLGEKLLCKILPEENSPGGINLLPSPTSDNIVNSL